MKKKYIIAGVLLLIFVAVGYVAYRAIGSLDQIILSAVNKYGSEITQAEVRLDGVSLDLAGGKAALNGLYIGNPEGFQTEYALKLDEVMVTLDIDSITSDVVVIKEIMVNGPDVIYEMASGGSNIDTLSDNITAYTGSDSGDKEEGGTKMIIEDLYIREGNVSVSHSMLKGKSLSAPMPDIHLEDIGKEDEGASPGEVAKEIMGSIKSSVGNAVDSLNLGEVMGNVGDALKKGTTTVIDKSKEAGEKIKGLFKRD